MLPISHFFLFFTFFFFFNASVGNGTYFQPMHQTPMRICWLDPVSLLKTTHQCCILSECFAEESNMCYRHTIAHGNKRKVPFRFNPQEI